ncbi:2-amino-4-ketopentanoate thiolase [Oceanobacillus zhaokaii]|uniref:2-amino-4-ketopentanoate thiolase n=1 Tax=Oceanobacillus zhaokaii TaxID=2052660 RepID=A0A345PK77_9BACI|nr:2-amino-4-oxopentanoate thiolase subunit OrtA [Oceanobacillus zhaokaii]AXI10407.1 2-amino-4-ketopentanoate thiolase [Oceanobacillus zhaokaii]
MNIVKKGTWVEVKNIILNPEDRLSQLPKDTKEVPYEMKVKGFLANDANINENATIRTLSGRLIKGELTQLQPEYNHSFGPPVIELLHIGEEEINILNNRQ